MINIEIRCSDISTLNTILDIAEECGGIIDEKSPLMYGYYNYKIPIENCNGTLFEKILNTKVGVVKV